MTLFLIRSDILNCLIILVTMVVTTRSGYNSLKVIFTKQLLTKVTIFCCCDVCSVQPPQIFKVQAKISIVWPMFPDYLSFSYDYDNIKEHPT